MKIVRTTQRMLLILTSVFFLCCVDAKCQISTATVLGSVSDSTGAKVPGASIVLRDLATGLTATVLSDSQGFYAAQSLPIGSYQLQAQHEGFKTSVAGPVTLTVGRQEKIDFVLNPGAAMETVTVNTEVPTVDTTDNSVGFLVGREQVENLPLNGRNFVQLTLLAPGVQPVPQENTEGASTMVPFGFGSPQRFSVAGGRPQGQLFLQDGTDTAGVWGNSTGVNLAGTSLGVDAIQEFEVLTDTYSAKYGGNGGVVNAALRSGTNEFTALFTNSPATALWMHATSSILSRVHSRSAVTNSVGPWVAPSRKTTPFSL